MKKRILIVVNTMGTGGAEHALISMLRTIPAGLYDIDLFSIVGIGDLFADIPNHVKILNESFDVGSVADNTGRKKLTMLVLKRLFAVGIFTYLPRLLKIRKIQKKRMQGKERNIQYDKLFWELLAMTSQKFDSTYDLALAYIEGAATYYVADYVKAKKKASFVHVDYNKAGYMEKIDRKYYDKIDKIFCVSTDVRNSFLRVYPYYSDYTDVIKNILIPDDIRRLSMLPGGFEDGFDGLRILTVARLHPQKALDISVMACKLLISRGKKIRWYVIGEGPLRRELEKQIDELGIKNSLFLLGTKTNPYPYMRQCDIYVQASHFEGWSIAIEEALILSKPTIISKVAGGTDQVQSGVTGLLLEKLSPEKLAAAVESLIENPNLLEKLRCNLSERRRDYAKDLSKLYALLD